MARWSDERWPPWAMWRPSTVGSALAEVDHHEQAFGRQGVEGGTDERRLRERVRVLLDRLDHADEETARIPARDIPVGQAGAHDRRSDLDRLGHRDVDHHELAPGLSAHLAEGAR